MKKLGTIILILLVHLKGFASSDGLYSQFTQLISGLVPSSESGSERVPFPGNVNLHINKTSAGFEFSVASLSQDPINLLTVDSLDAITTFLNQSQELTSIPRVEVKDSSNKSILPASNWFGFEAGSFVYLLLKNHKSFKVFKIPFTKDNSLNDMSVSPIRINGNYSYLISIKNKNNIGRTYILDPSNANVSIVQEKFHKLNAIVDGNLKESFIFDDSTNKIRLPNEPEISLNEILQTKYKFAEILPQAKQVSTIPLNDKAESSISKSNSPEVRVQAEAPAKSTSTSKTDIHKEFEYNGEIFKIFSIDSEIKGTFITRKSDNIQVMISTQVVQSKSSDFGGFNFKDGILSHPDLLRSVDLGLPGASEDMFKVESTFRPEVEKKEAVEWMLESFQDFRDQSKNEMAPIEKRKEIVNDIQDILFSGKTTSQILVGEGSDKDLVLSAISKRLPRTWKALDFDPGGIGDISMSGYLEEKGKKISDAIKSIPMVLFAMDFPNFAGFGATQSSSRDILSILRKNFTSPSGHLKLIGTAYNTDEIIDRIKDPSILGNFKLISVDELTTSEIKEHLRKYFSFMHNGNQAGVELSDTFLDYLIKKGKQIKPIDPEPSRSEDFLASIIRSLIKNKSFNSESFNAAEIDKAVSYHFKISPELATERGQNGILSKLLSEIGKMIIGHGHIIQDVFMGSGIGLFGLHSDRGPMQNHWLEGPPGVGKTELAKAIAAALKVPLSYIEMNQFKSGSGNTSTELLSQIATSLKKNPYSVILLDEVEKADPKVLEGLLAILSNDKFSYYEDQGNGKRKTKRESAVNATFVFTSNGIGELVLQWYYDKITQDEKYANLSSEEINKEFLSEFSKEKIIEMLVSRGLPRPLLDRVNYFNVTFPPGFDASVALLKLKLSEIKKQTKSSMEIQFKLGSDDKSEDQIIKVYVSNAMKERKSVRNTISDFEKAVKGSLVLLRMKNLDYKNDKYYIVNPFTSTSVPLRNKCSIMYIF